MFKKIYFILFPLIIIFALSSCKEQGDPFLSWRKPSSQIMININGAYLHLSAYEDSVLFAGVHTAEILAEINKINSDSLQIIEFGHCISLENNYPVLNAPTTDTDGRIIDTFTVYTKENSPYFEGSTDSAFKYTSEIYNLFIDTTYFTRTYAIVKYNSGKYDTAYNQVSHAFRTKIPQDIWFHKPDFNGDGRTEAVSFVLNNKAYIATGYDGLQLLDDLWKYDPYGGPENKGTWTQLSDFGGTPRKSAVAFTINDTAYVGTGIIDLSNNTPTGDMWKWTEEGGMYNYWRRIDSLGKNGERYNAVAFTLTVDDEKRGYIALGTRSTNFNDLLYYNPDADSAGATTGAAWVSGDTYLGGNVTEAVVAVLNNRAIVGSGIDNEGTYRNDFYVFDPTAGASGRWRGITQSCPAPPRANGVAFALSFSRSSTTKNYFYFGTGRDQDSLYNDWWRYDYVQGKWEQCSDIKDDQDIAQARQGGIGFGIVKKEEHVEYGTLERGFVGLGVNDDNDIKTDFWEYLP